jgi:hypothetical protein
MLRQNVPERLGTPMIEVHFEGFESLRAPKMVISPTNRGFKSHRPHKASLYVPVNWGQNPLPHP